MKPSELIIGLVLFSGLSIGFMTFYTGTATYYVADNTELVAFTTHLNETSTVSASLASIQSKIQTFNPVDLTSWGNLVGIVVDVFQVLFGVPIVFNQELTYMASEITLIPQWFIGIIEIIILALLVFGAISALNQHDV